MLSTKLSLFLGFVLVNTDIGSAQEICNNQVLTGNYPDGVTVKRGKWCTLDGADLKGKNIFCEEGCRDLTIKDTKNIEKIEYVKPRRNSQLQIIRSELEGEVKVSEGKNIGVTLIDACGSSEGVAKLLVEKLTGSSSIRVLTNDNMYSTGCTCKGLGEVKVVESRGGPFTFRASDDLCPLKIKNGVLFQKNSADIDLFLIQATSGDLVFDENDGQVDVTGSFDSGKEVKFIKNDHDVSITCVGESPKNIVFDNNLGQENEIGC